MEDPISQGSELSSTENMPVSDVSDGGGSAVDDILAHLEYKPEAKTAEVETEQPPEPAVEPQKVDEIKPAEEVEPKGRLDKRIAELTAEKSKVEQDLVQLLTAIKADPELDALFRKKYSLEPQAQSGTTSPQWDPDDEDSVKQWFSNWASPLKKELEELKQFKQSVVEMSQKQEQEAYLGHISDLAYAEIPAAAENPAIATALVSFINAEIQQFNQLPEYERQQFQDPVAYCVKKAAETARSLGLGEPKTVTSQPAQKPFVESATNLVAPKGDEPKDLLSMISAHIGKTNAQ